MRALAARLRGSTRGSAAVEFALLAPVMFVLLLGVMQIGVAMQNYNALRGITADMARTVTVEYQKSNPLTNAQIEALGTATAVQPPYMLDNDSVVVSVVDAVPQRIAGARELRFTIRYTVPSVLALIDLPSVPIRYSRPIFVAVEVPGTAAGGAA